MTSDTFQAYSAKDLAQLAKKRGVPGWHSMRKDQLVKALVRLSRPRTNGVAAHVPAATQGRRAGGAANLARPATPARRGAPAPAKVAVKPSSASKPLVLKRAKSPHVARRLQEARENIERAKNLAALAPRDQPGGATRDRLVLMVRDSFWLHAYWELSRQGVERARAALGQEWHLAVPTLRLLEVVSGVTTSSSETVARDILIHGGVNNWYVDVQEPPKSYRMEIGYRASSGRFYGLARSNIVTTPRAGASDSIDQNWTTVAENFEKIYAMSGGYAAEGPSVELQELFEERLRRPMGSPMVTRYGAGVEGLIHRQREFAFEVDAELIVFGNTDPDAHVTLQGEPVKLRPDGTFTVRFSLPNARQVIPAVACSADGLEQRTVVLAIERNTKTMEPLVRDAND